MPHESKRGALGKCLWNLLLSGFGGRTIHTGKGIRRNFLVWIVPESNSDIRISA